MSKVLTTPGLQKLIELTQNDLLLKANKADLGTAAYTASTAYDQAGAASTAETNAKNYADGLASNYATAAQGALADTAVQPGDLATVATTGDYDDLLNKPTIPAAQVNSDWNANSGVAEILNKPTTLAGYGITDGANTDLSNITSTGKAESVSWGVPDYASVITGTAASSAWTQCVKTSFVCVYGTDPFTENYYVYVSPDNGTTKYIVGRRYDDVNSNTQETSFTFIVPAGWYFNCGAESGNTYYIYPLKGAA